MTEPLQKGSLWRALRPHGFFSYEYGDVFLSKGDIIMVVSCEHKNGTLRKWNVSFIFGEKVYGMEDVKSTLWESFYERVK